LRNFGPKKGVSFGRALSSATYAKLVRGTQRTIGLLDCCILEETSQK